jgi:hypothetical protein
VRLNSSAIFALSCIFIAHVISAFLDHPKIGLIGLGMALKLVFLGS